MSASSAAGSSGPQPETFLVCLVHFRTEHQARLDGTRHPGDVLDADDHRLHPCMTPDRHPAVVIAGYPVLTSHATAAEDIGALWAKVQASGLLADAEPWMIYDQYRDGTYRALLGKRLEPGEATPEGLLRLELPAQEGVSVRSPAEPEALIETWETIWSHWPNGEHRAFVADIEHWSSDGIHIFIGLEE